MSVLDELTAMVLDGIEADGLVVAPRELWGVGVKGGVRWHPGEPDGFREVCAVPMGPVTHRMDAAARHGMDVMLHRDARPIDMTPPPRRRGEERK